MTAARCETCGDAATDGRPCDFCARFNVTPRMAPHPVVRIRVMRELDRLDAVLDAERQVTRAWHDEARRERTWRRVATIAALAAFGFGMMMLNALPSAQAAEPRGLVDVRAERLLRAWCPAEWSMPRRHCVAWMRVAQCETGGQQWAVTYRSLRQIRWRYNGRSGFDGAHQWRASTWLSNVGRIPARRLTRLQYVARARGGYAFAYAAPPAVQVLAADALRVRRDGGGLGHWPSCGRRW